MTAAGLAAAAVLVAGLLTRLTARLVTAALAVAVAAALAAPAIWSASALDVKYDGAPSDAGAGPAAVTSGGQDPACRPGSEGSTFTACS